MADLIVTETGGVHRPRNVDWKRAAGLLYGDWGTSKAYVIGLAFLAAGFSSLPIILAVCVLTGLVGINYAVICRYFPDGGGVYSAARSQGRLLAVVGALLLIADLTVTAALSGWSGLTYVIAGTEDIFWLKFLKDHIAFATIGVLLVLGFINWFGPKHSGSLAVALALPTVIVVVALIAISIPYLTTHFLEPRHESLSMLLLLAGLITREKFHLAAVTVHSIWAWIYLVLIGAIIGFTAYIYLLRHCDPAKVATYAYVNPIVAVILGALFAGEHLASRTILAAALIIGSVAIVITTQQLIPKSMTAIQAYDGEQGWKVYPFQGRKDPEKMSADDTKSLMEEAEIDGPLVDWKAKGSTVEYLGTEDVDGTSAHKLKVVRKNGDVTFVFLDPDAFLEIRKTTQRVEQGAQVEVETDVGDYEKIAGVFLPFSIESGRKGDPDKQKIVIDKAEPNISVDDATFKFPTAK